MSDETFTTTALTAKASQVLLEAGFRQVDASRIGDWPAPAARVFEDPYSLAAVVAYETWGDLSAQWLDAQAALAELITAHFGREDAKAWEGYLVLMTPSVLPHDSRLDALAIRSNTTHTRKLLMTADDLDTLDDVERGLLPLLPLPFERSSHEQASALDLLPELMERRGIRRDAIEALIQAFGEQQPLAERLHQLPRDEQ